MQSTLNESPADTWQHLAPLLDEAMDRLGQTDRDALVFRYFENKTAAEIGAVLRLNEETARKRVNRALEKLHRYLARRGMISSAGAVGLAISAHSVQPAPAGLEQTVISVAAVKGSGATAATLTLVKHTLSYMIWSKLISALAIGAAVLLTAGTATLLAQPQDENPLNGGRISYKMLDDACRLVESVDQSKFIFHVLLESKNHNLHPADIHLTIDSKVKGAIPLQLNTNWEVLNFPHDPELRRENPRIQSGQPKGSMNVTVMTLLPKPDGLAFPYRRLGEELDEVNRVIGLANGIILAGYSGELSPYKTKARTAIFQFPRTQTGKAKIEIAAAAGKKELVADRNGRIRLTLDESLLKENPQVTLSEAPRFIVPDLPHP